MNYFENEELRDLARQLDYLKKSKYRSLAFSVLNAICFSLEVYITTTDPNVRNYIIGYINLIVSSYEWNDMWKYFDLEDEVGKKFRKMLK